ncbi:hypothetical protein SADUNF_Sadunf17G0118800 [Salix dunnii]|uniref:MATH domain-containing protein n=1 Tax=Salix dunnii TaxID=1413687 RepID=A0A835J5W2_9ROSI|nr:hypothetical protein SADUNF_Sadunf17G0118800 [Salix dunnii]
MAWTLSEWSFPDIISYDELEEVSNGYLVNDCIILGVEIFVLNNTRKGESLSFVKEPETGLFTWKIDSDSLDYSTGYMSLLFLLLKELNGTRIGAIAAVAAIVLVKEAMFSQDIANGLEFRFATPDQRSVEEAESGARDYAQSLLQLKDLLESQSWKEAQKVLRRRSSNLKLDLYAVIESKPGKDRPQLRTLYSNLFNNVTKLDYAVRDRDVSIVWQCYENIVATYDLILSRI